MLSTKLHYIWQNTPKLPNSLTNVLKNLSNKKNNSYKSLIIKSYIECSFNNNLIAWTFIHIQFDFVIRKIPLGQKTNSKAYFGLLWLAFRTFHLELGCLLLSILLNTTFKSKSSIIDCQTPWRLNVPLLIFLDKDTSFILSSVMTLKCLNSVA